MNSLKKALILMSTFVGLIGWMEPSFGDKPIIRIGIYTDPDCKTLKSRTPSEPGILLADTAQACQTVYYADSKGKFTPATLGHYRCYPDHIVVDKYYLQATCDKNKPYKKDYVFFSKKCHAAPSHEGTVYEKLIDYHYPGHEDCSMSPASFEEPSKD
jgi:hypothetical protein